MRPRALWGRASPWSPPLTTVNQPTERKGELAARLLLDAVQGGDATDRERTVLPTELVVRGTTGSPQRNRS
jgi:DNA-binding LacI/PurR family transcriptional regulator